MSAAIDVMARTHGALSADSMDHAPATAAICRLEASSPHISGPGCTLLCDVFVPEPRSPPSPPSICRNSTFSRHRRKWPRLGPRHEEGLDGE